MKSRLQVLVVLLFIGIAGAVFVFSGKNEGKETGLKVVEDISQGSADYSKSGYDKTADLTDVDNKKEEFTKNGQGNSVDIQPTAEESQNVGSGRIFVHVCGAVRREGVYELSPDARVVDAIRAAGGCTKKAASFGINQAEALKDGVQVYVPTKAELKKETNGADRVLASLGVGGVRTGLSSQGPNSGEGGDALININLATKEELMKLNGVGEAKAELIITYRQAKGGFRDIKDIMKIKGIKQKFFDKIKDKICI